MSPAGALVMDLRALPPPRPLEVALHEISRLPPGGVLHLVLVHEPAPLFALLPDRGIDWRCRVAGPSETHVACWRKGDAAAEGIALAEVP